MLPNNDEKIDIPKIEGNFATPSEQSGSGSSSVTPYVESAPTPPLPENEGLTKEQIGRIDPYVDFQRVAEVAAKGVVGFEGPIRWKGDGWGRYNVDDWFRSYENLNRLVADSGIQRQMVETTYLPSGLPAEWDYSSSKVGPWGEPLPDGASGWTPLGEADFGPGVSGWWKKQWNKIAEAKTQEELIADIPEQYIGENYSTVRDALWDEGNILGWLGHVIGAPAKLLQYRIQERATENPSPFVRYISGFASNIVIEGVLEGFNQATIAVERIIGPDLLASADIIDREAAKGHVMWMEVVDKIPVVREASRILLGGLLATGAGIEGVNEYKSLRTQYREMEGDDWAIMGSRISYSLATDQMLREEYKRRIREGQDPRLLSMDLELPGVELGTRLFLDPLNLLVPFGKIAKARKLEKLGKLIHSTPIDELAGISDDIADVVKATSARGLAAKSAVVTTKVQEAFAKVRGGILDLGSKRGLRVLTATSKRAVVGRRVGDHLNVMFQHFAGRTDDFFTYINGMVLAASDNANEVQRGIAMLADSGAPLNMAFSQAGTEMGVFMREVLYDTARGTLNDAKTLLGGIDEITDTASFMGSVANKLDDAYRGVFPTIHEQIAQNDELAKLITQFGEASDEVAEYLAKTPQAGKIVSNSKRLMATADLNMQKYFYGPAAKAQSFVYMRMNPVYAMRNRWTNAFHVLVDEGPMAAYKSFHAPTKALAEIEGLLGFIPPTAYKGIGAKGGVRGLEGAFEGGDFWNWSKKAQQYEQAASAQVYAKSIRESMRKGMQEGIAIPGRSFLTGFTDEESDLVIGLAKRHNGDVAKIQADIRAMASGEGVNAAKNLLFLGDDEIKALKDLRLYEDSLKIGLEANNLDEVDELIDGLKAQYADEASRAAKEAAVLGEPLDNVEAAEVADNLALEEGLAEAGGKADETADLMARQILADRAMLKEQEVILADMEQDFLLRARANLEVEVAAGRMSATEANNQAKKVVDDLVSPIRAETTRITDEAVRSADNLRNSVLEAKGKSFGIGRNLRGAERDAKFAAVWGATGLPSKPASFFVDMTPKKFRRLMWEEYFPSRNAIWVSRREQSFALNNVLMHEMGAGLEKSTEEMADLLSRTYRKAANARMFSKAELLEDGTAVVRMNGAELRDALMASHADVIGLNRAADAAVAGKLEVEAQKLDGLLQSLAARPDMPIEDAYGYVVKDKQMREALRTIAGDDIKKQQEALSVILNDGKFSVAADAVPGAAPKARKLDDLVDSQDLLQGESVVFKEGKYKGETGTIIKQEMQVEEGGRDVYAVTVELSDGRRISATTGNLSLAEEAAPEAGRGATEFVQELTAPDVDGLLNSPARNAYETMPAATEALENLRRGLHENWGDIRSATLTPEMERSSQAFLGELNTRVTELKATSVEVANQTRDFILLDYSSRTGLDNMLSYIYPYHFWYKGTYTNWMQRIRYNPALAGRYAQYRKWLEKKHAGMPDWWKYNINIQEDLLGIETDSPLWFNLESTLNPMNGLTGVDFNDSKKRLDWWSSTADDLSKFGPTVWTPYSLAIAVRYHMQGQEDAASRWAGRLTPLTRTFRDATALLGMNEGQGVEVDPFINFFGNGIDPYERARIGRTLSSMVAEGKYPEAALIDAAYAQEGPLWDEAFSRSIHQRAPNAMSIAAPFFLGSGFKPRTESDAEIDRFWAEKDALMGSKSEKSPEAYQEGWDDLRNKYPFMDALLLSRKSGDDRDEALAWNVLDRIPPGMTDDLATLVGINESDISNFYDSKGDLNSMSESDQLRFMAAVIDIGALLDLPDATTRAEWDRASNAHRALLAEGKTLFGADIWDRVDVFYGKADEDRDSYLKSNPEVEQAMDWKQQGVISNPILSPYYTSIDRIEKYLKGKMYDVIEGELGAEIWDEWEVYHRLNNINAADSRRYYKDHPELERYGDMIDEMEPQIGIALSNMSSMLPAAKPPNWRGAAPDNGYQVVDNETEAWIRSQILQYSSGGEQPKPGEAAGSSQQWLLEALGERGMNLLLDGPPFPAVLERRLEELGLAQ